LKPFFDAIARRYDRVYARPTEAPRRGLARILGELPPRSRVLDLGVGTGRELSALLDAGHTPVGLDSSAEMLALCARRARPVTLVHADLWQRMPWDDASFDAVIALHGTLSHPPSMGALETFPDEVVRLLRPTGVFVAEVPSPLWLEEATRAATPSVVRLGEDRARFVDDATGASVEARFLPREAWQRLFGGALDVRVDVVDEVELLIVGRRRRGGATGR
jgi:SAM-dependent methyltransferase